MKKTEQELQAYGREILGFPAQVSISETQGNLVNPEALAGEFNKLDVSGKLRFLELISKNYDAFSAQKKASEIHELVKANQDNPALMSEDELQAMGRAAIGKGR